MAEPQRDGGDGGAGPSEAGLLAPPPAGLARHLDLVALLLLGATALWLWRHWDAIPDPFPIHWGKEGADAFVVRTSADVFRPIAIGAVLVLLTAGLRRLVLLAIRLKVGRSARAEAARWLAGSLLTGAAWFFAVVLSAGALSPLTGDPHPVAQAAGAGALALAAVLAVGVARLARTPADPER